MPSQTEGITVVGEAFRRVPPERAEFLIEIVASAPTAAVALRDSQAKATQVTQAIASLGVQPIDIQTISLKIQSQYGPLAALPNYGGFPQIGTGGFSPDVQFGSYHARNVLRVSVRELVRVGEIADAVTRAGAAVIGALSFQVADDFAARQTALEAAAKNAQMKGEALATATGKQIGDLVAMTEEVVLSNGIYAAARASLPALFGAAGPEVAGELEYYARVSATFQLH